MAGTGDPYMRTYGENGRDMPYNLPSDNYGHAHYSSNGVHISEPVIAPSPIPANATLLGRSKQQLTTQQVTQVTKVIREVQHLGPDGQPLDYNPYGVTTAPGAGPRYAAANYEHIGVQEPLYRTHSPASEAGSRRYPEYRTYADYDQYGVLGPGGPGPGTGPGPGSHSQSGGLYYPDLAHPHHPAHYMDAGSGPGGVAGPPMMYADRPPTPPSPSERSQSPPPHQTLPRDYGRQSVPYPTGYPELDVTMGQQSDRYAYERAPSTSGYRESPGPNTPLYTRGAYENMAVNGLSPAHAHNHPHVMHRDYEDTGSAPSPRVVYDDEGMAPPPPARERDLYGTLSPPSAGMGQPADSSGVRWRDPDLHEVIAFLQNPNSVVRANAAAYLQHLCYSADAVKQQTRLLGGIPPLVALLSHDVVDVHRNACGALRNLSYGRQNDENKRALHKAGGIPALIRLLQRSPDQDVRELVTSVLWNLSSCEELKRPILDEAVLALVQLVVIPHSGWDRTSPGPTHWSPLFRNATGVLRNISSAGEHARKTMREMEGVIEALLYVVRGSLDPAHQQMDNKSVENCVCVLRNLSYRCQEVEDPNYDKHPLPSGSGTTSGATTGTPRSQATPSQEPSGCFGGGRKKKDGQDKGTPSSPSSHSQQTQEKVRTEPPKGMELLWQPEVVQPYLALLSNCSNPETLEAAAGAIQNLAACYWQPAIDVRAAVRKEKGLPVLVELLRMEVDRVVCAVATALRNLALDQRNKELIGKYAMRDLVQKLPATASGHDTPSGASDDTVAAVLATLHEVIKKNAEFARSLLDEGGVDRLVALSRQRGRYSSRVVKFASQVLSALWGHQELRDVYKKMGWKESDFVQKGGPTTSSSASSTNNGSAIGGSGLGSGSGGREPSSPGTAANSTLNRPMASQGGTRYEDKTLSLHRPHAQPKYRNEEVPLADMQYPEGSSHAPPVGGVRIFPPQPKPGEPVYAQVNREKKRSRQYDGVVDGPEDGGAQQWTYDEQPHTQPTNRAHMEGQPGGDSWV